MFKTCLNISFPSSMNKMRATLQDIVSFFTIMFPWISDEDLLELRLIYGELLVNAVIHGNKQDFSKDVHIKIEISHHNIFTVIQDEGRGFNYFEVLKNNNVPEAIYTEGGRGLRLVSSLVDNLRFNYLGNEIEFNKKITSQQASRIG